MFKRSPPLQEPEFQTLRAQDSNLPQMILTFYNFPEIFDIAISQGLYPSHFSAAASLSLTLKIQI